MRHYKNSFKPLERLLPEIIYYRPLVSILLPSWNEGNALTNAVEGLLKQSYENIEIIIINDGSTDDTGAIADMLSNKYKKVIAIHKANGGKSSALNLGIEKSNGSIILCMDADSILDVDTVYHVVDSFKDSSIDAVAGNVKVANRSNLLTNLQANEYIAGLNLQTRAFAELGCVQVIPGAIGAFRKEVICEVGFYSHDTKVEDMDLTIALGVSGKRVQYNGRAVAYTEAPVDLKNLYKQRRRWSQGAFKVISKYEDYLFSKKYKTMGLLGLPYIALSPFARMITSVIYFASIILGIVYGFTIYYFALLGLAILIQAFVSLYLLHIDKENKFLVLVTLIEVLLYNHFLAVISIISFYKTIFGGNEQWEKIPRLGKNTIPAVS